MPIPLAHRVSGVLRETRRRALLATLALRVCTLLLMTGAAQGQDVGDYRVKKVRGGFAGFGCQARTELYFLDRSGAKPQPVYLGTCGTPRFVTDHMHMPSDPSCFAIAADSASLVYFHRPNWCGAGDRAKAKAGGVYLHSARQGDRLLYRDSDQVAQLWSRDTIDAHSIRVRWISALRSLGGAACSQNLVIGADGRETPEGAPRPDARCREPRDTSARASPP